MLPLLGTCLGAPCFLVALVQWINFPKPLCGNSSSAVSLPVNLARFQGGFSLSDTFKTAFFIRWSACNEMQPYESASASAVEGGLQMRCVVWMLLAGILLSSAPVGAQKCSGRMVAWIPEEVLERPTTLQQGIGSVHEQVTTKLPGAQSFYDQGLNYLYDFVWIEAARSFHQALRIDPNLAMAWIGLSRTYASLGSMDEAQAAGDEANNLAPQASSLDQEKIKIWRAILASDQNPEDADLQKKAIDAADEALVHHPRDVQLWMLRAQAEPSETATIAFYDRALDIAPNDSGPLHLRMHALEGIGELENAVSDGALLVKLAPAVPHAHHMYAHELRRAGRTQDAIAQFKEAEQLEVAYYGLQHIPAEYDWHHMHNLNMLASAYLHEGELVSAEKTLRESILTPSIAVQYAIFKEDWPEFLLLRGRNEEALAAAREMTQEKWPQPRVIGHALAGEALLAMGDRVGAEAELQAARKEVDGNKQTTEGVDYHAKTLAAELSLGTPEAQDGIAALQELEGHFGEAKSPDQWNQGLFQMERIGRLARLYQAWGLAKHTAEQMIKMDPYYAGSHFALALADRHEQAQSEARREFDAARHYWRRADSAMPEFAEALQATPRKGHARNDNWPK